MSKESNKAANRRCLTRWVRWTWEGCGHLPGYGNNRATAILGMLVCAGAFAGSHRGAWWTLWGALIMFGIYGPFYLVGAYERARDFHSANSPVLARSDEGAES